MKTLQFLKQENSENRNIFHLSQNFMSERFGAIDWYDWLLLCIVLFLEKEMDVL